MSSVMARVGIERRPLGLADIALVVWLAILAAVTVYGAATTTGFLTVSNLKAILTAASFVGNVFANMGKNIMASMTKSLDIIDTKHILCVPM